MNNLKKKLLTPALAALAVTAALSGCNNQPVKEAACSLPQGNKVESAFAQAKSELGRSTCHFEFDNFETALMVIAKGAPGKENQKRFFDFYTWSADQGVITKNQAKTRYTRNFTTSYGTSLPDGYSNCATGKRMDGILSSLKSEAKAKQQGLKKILGDRSAWFDAKGRHDNLVFILETTALACEESHRG